MIESFRSDRGVFIDEKFQSQTSLGGKSGPSVFGAGCRLLSIKGSAGADSNIGRKRQMMEKVVPDRADDGSEMKVTRRGPTLGLEVGIGSDNRYIVVDEIHRMDGPNSCFFVLVLKGVWQFGFVIA